VEFICAYHQRRLEALSLHQQRDLWLLWMESALVYYERLDWSRGASFSGSAFDLARLVHRFQGRACMPVEMTLAAIFLARLFREQGLPNQGDWFVNQARELLGASERPSQAALSEEVDECLEVLQRPARQEPFFETYLNWPVILNDRALAEPVFHREQIFH